MINAKYNMETKHCHLKTEGTGREIINEFGVITQNMFENFPEDLIIELVSTAAELAYAKEITKKE